MTANKAESVDIIRRITLLGLFANLGLSVVKFIAGLSSSSQAMVADSVHSMSDMLTDLAVIIAAGFWLAPADADHPHGHARIETVVSFFIGLTLFTVAIGLAWQAFSRLYSHEFAVPGWAAFWVACISIASKEALYRWNIIVGKRIKSSALIANAWHHRSDAFSSLPVAIAVFCIHFEPGWAFLDQVAAIIVTVLIVKAAWSISWPALQQLVDTGASEADRRTIMQLARELPEVKDVHKLRTRSLGEGWQIDLHIQVDPEMTVKEGHVVSGRVKQKLLEEGPNVIDVLVHLEPYFRADGRSE